VKKHLAIAAASTVLAYVSLVALTGLQDFAGWPARAWVIGAAAIVCGVLLAAMGEEPAWALAAVFEMAVLTIVFFGAMWTYLLWWFVRRYVSYLEVLGSTVVFAQIVQNGLLIFVLCVLPGALGAVAGQILLDRYRR